MVWVRGQTITNKLKYLHSLFEMKCHFWATTNFCSIHTELPVEEMQQNVWRVFIPILIFNSFGGMLNSSWQKCWQSKSSSLGQQTIAVPRDCYVRGAAVKNSYYDYEFTLHWNSSLSQTIYTIIIMNYAEFGLITVQSGYLGSKCGTSGEDARNGRFLRPDRRSGN